MTGAFRRHIGNRVSNRCCESDCRSRIDVHHIILTCAAWQTQLILVQQEPEKQVISWSSTVRQLLMSWKTTSTVPDFLATKRARRKLRAQEQKQKQEEIRRIRDEAWGLDEERLEGTEDEDKGNR